MSISKFIKFLTSKNTLNEFHLLITPNFRNHLVINGNCKLSILSGSLLINGVKFNSTTEFNVYSSSVTSRVSLQYATSSSLTKHIEEGCTYLKLTSIVDCFYDIIQYEAFKCLVEVDNNCSNIFRNYTFNLTEKEEADYQISDEMNTALFNIKFKSSDATYIMICGDKDVGKSSYLRHMINWNLAKDNKSTIYVLDTDPGQTEFCTSASLSLVRITAPLLSPPFAHQLAHNYELIQQNFIGQLSPPDCFDLYLQSVKNLYETLQHEIQQNCHHRPPIIFINTMGFLRDAGLTILAYKLEMIKPDYMIYLQKCCDQNKNMSVHEICEKHVINNSNPNFKKITIKIPNINKKKTLNFKPSKYRHLMNLTYLHNQVYNKINFIKPKDFNDNPVTRLRCKHPLLLTVLEPAQMTQPLNTSVNACVYIKSLKGLDKSPGMVINFKDDMNDFYLKWVGICKKVVGNHDQITWLCLGMGLVSHVKVQEYEIDLITGVSPEKLHGSTLIQGKFDLPFYLFPNEFESPKNDD